MMDGWMCLPSNLINQLNFQLILRLDWIVSSFTMTSDSIGDVTILSVTYMYVFLPNNLLHLSK